MKIWEDIDRFDAKSPVVTIGIFDGVHKGHKFLLKKLVNMAEEVGGESVVMTLWPHPRSVLSGDVENLRYLNTLEEKIILLRNEGINHLVIVPFTREFSELDSCSFVDKYLVKKLRIAHLMVGFNHRFGKDRAGDIESLRKCGSEFGFTMSKVEPLHLGEENISSTYIRELMDNGELEKVNDCLGYDYFLIGKVVEGNRIGRTIGFPTANIELPDRNKLLPKIGVYAVHLSHEGKIYEGMLNIGYRPTVENESKRKSIEVHLFDFESDLYQKRVAIAFRSRMREEKKFENVEQLKSQLEQDRIMAIEYLKKFR